MTPEIKSIYIQIMKRGNKVGRIESTNDGGYMIDIVIPKSIECIPARYKLQCETK